MDCANTLHQVRRNSQMVHERVSLQIIQVFGLVDFFDHSIDCFYQYSSGISPAVSDCFFPLQQSGLIGQRCSLCGQVFINEDSLVFVNAVVPLQLSARFENLVPGRLTPESHNYCALPRTTVLVFLGAQAVATLQIRNSQLHPHFFIYCLARVHLSFHSLSRCVLSFTREIMWECPSVSTMWSC